MELVPVGTAVNSDASRAIGVRNARLAIVQYGAIQDCSSGCFSANLCAVELDGEAYLLSANWYAEEEIPPQVAELCGSVSFSTETCRTPAFDVLLPSELSEIRDVINGSGPLRFCSVPRFAE